MKMTVKVEGHTIQVEIKDPYARPVIAIVDGETFEVHPEESPVAIQPVQVKSEPFKSPHRSNGNYLNGKSIHAPLPGVVVSVGVKSGDVVTIGQEICIIEAMKMKNPIRTPRAGTIASVNIAVGQQVSHSDSLVEFDV